MRRAPVLVVAAHPDDEVLGCGGTIRRLSRDHAVHILILGEGVTARYARRAQAPGRALAQLQRAARTAAKDLGASSVSFGGFPDNRFDDVPLLELVKCVEARLRAVRPRAVYTHHGGDLNIDHALTFRAVLTATRPVDGMPVRELYAFEIPSATEWSFQRLEPVFRPSLFVDISATVQAKLRAMRRYRGETRPFPHPRSTEALRAIARRWGSVAGLPYAEAFEIIRTVR